MGTAYKVHLMVVLRGCCVVRTFDFYAKVVQHCFWDYSGCKSNQNDQKMGEEGKRKSKFVITKSSSICTKTQ